MTMFTLPSQGRQTLEQDVAYKLLIELLAHQFAYPVQWINTQRALLSGEGSVQRVIEIGPAEVLTGMAKKTAARNVRERDMAHATERDFLFVGDSADARRIYFEYDDARDDSSVEAAAPPTQNTSAAANKVPPVSAPGPALAAVPDTAVGLPVSITLVPTETLDVGLSPTDIILTVVAQKLRRGFDETPLKDSIRTLSAGKSVLQNEILGDLGAEFGDLPEGSEDLALESLGLRLAASFTGKPGKSVKKLVERMLSSKMPAGFNQAAVGEYLRVHWGLGPDTQQVVLCCAITMEPTRRLADVSQAQEFFDSVVARYVAHAGVSLPNSSTMADATHGQQSALVQVDQTSLDALRKDHTEYLRKQFQLLARHLNIDVLPQIGTTTEVETLRSTSHLQEELDDEFIAGIQGIFQPRQQRSYASFWNWVREDVVRLIHSQAARRPGVTLASITSERWLQSLANRWTPALENMLRRAAEAGPSHIVAHGLLSYKPVTFTDLPRYRYQEPALAPHTAVDEQGQIHYSEVPRGKEIEIKPSPTASYYYMISSPASRDRTHVHLRNRTRGSWEFDAGLTEAYFSALHQGMSTGWSYAGKTALVTGAGPGSIGAEVVSGLLSGGAKVIVTTSRATSSAAPFFRQLYKEVGARGSELILLPFNAASKKDCEDLVTYIYDESKGLAADLDFVVPFAAIPESGRELDRIDARSELAHRAMLVNVLRMLGSIKQAKQRRRFTGRPTVAVLPLSPNHGDFGGDGLYSESKVGLETVFNRFHSENWSAYMSIVGAVIGWTRGTGLMNANNIVADGIEAMGVLTFTPGEMAFNILALLSPTMASLPDIAPVYADLSGGLQGVDGLKDKITSIREGINSRSRIRKAILEERRLERDAMLHGKAPSTAGETLGDTDAAKPRSNIRQAFPRLASREEMTAGLQDLRGMVDLSRTVVVVGFSELGPWGSSRTRWQIESQGRLDQNGYMEMAWIMGLIKHIDATVDGQPYVGWVDKKTEKPVHDADIATRYGKHIISHAGIRVIDVERLDGYDPANKELLHEIVLDEPLPPFEASESLAKAFKQRHGDKVSISPKQNEEDVWIVVVGAGSNFLVPKAVASEQFVAAQLPGGWDPVTYGIPEDVIAQVDPITLYVLCCVSEAMYSAGIEDPFELYKHIHVSELANCIGTGAGGLVSMRGMYKHRYVDKPIQGDILQETFLNSMSAWTNMLLFGSAGPIKTPTGTCATALESLDTACEAIQSRRVKVALVGGVDEFAEEGSHEFSNMKATANAAYEKTKGMLPAEMSRPMASSRAGFVEAAGCGVQLVMSAELALQMALPIYGVVAYTQLAGDGVGRSLPAPGQGILTAAREAPGVAHSPLLDLEYRRSRLAEDLASIDGWRLQQLQDAAVSLPDKGQATAHAVLESTVTCRKCDAQWMWNGGNLRQLNQGISPMRAALCIWGLNIDDIKVASMHGTSTRANDTNESTVLNTQLEHLGRSAGNPLLAVCQKYLTGHPKGAAAAWMLNGCLQMLESGLVPGNRNADDVEAALESCAGHLLYPSETIDCGQDFVKACMLTSFGFGQKGGIAMVVSARLLFAALATAQYDDYRERVASRRTRADQAYQRAMMQNTVFKAKEESAWGSESATQRAVFLNPDARL
ncbi:putative fatty acid synthase alpha subunit FasA [Pseudomassariella vexata]|uniref:beta-ketoacyl-[acyl-carrier-protein] synthase I n=1 Tax=Pseudomassariella vexata TaxID=1141098 RepID=A0A1Y2D7K8_9PEZI|nr:putative fatty acid synthase alpha subunit FasA [Pseudomassariella vexata]ORY55258.1 putative fatty acid synthase alpha subunit FasA [Pseudomassariella vexata]